MKYLIQQFPTDPVRRLRIERRVILVCFWIMACLTFYNILSVSRLQDRVGKLNADVNHWSNLYSNTFVIPK